MKKILFVATAAIVFVACNDNTASTASGTTTDSTSNLQEAKEERNKETALASVKSINGSAKIDDVFKDADKDIVDYNTGEMPAAKGVDSSKAMLQSFLSAVPDLKGSDLMGLEFLFH